MAEIESFITDLYAHYLGREPEPGAVDAWIGQLRGLGSPGGLVAQFFASGEFQGRHAGLVAEVAALMGQPALSPPAGPPTARLAYAVEWDTLGGTTSLALLRGSPPTLRLAVRNAGSEAWHQAKVVGVWDGPVSVPRPEAGLDKVVGPGMVANVALLIPVPTVADIYGFWLDVELPGIGITGADRLQYAVKVA